MRARCSRSYSASPLARRAAASLSTAAARASAASRSAAAALSAAAVARSPRRPRSALSRACDGGRALARVRERVGALRVGARRAFGLVDARVQPRELARRVHGRRDRLRLRLLMVGARVAQQLARLLERRLGCREARSERRPFVLGVRASGLRGRERVGGARALFGRRALERVERRAQLVGVDARVVARGVGLGGWMGHVRTTLVEDRV